MSTRVNLSLRERLLAKKKEIEDALAELDRIEALAGGAAARQVGETSIAQAVYEALCARKSTLADVASLTGYEVQQVKYALTGHRLRDKYDVFEEDGIKRYSIKPEFALPARRSSVSAAILDVLESDMSRVWKTVEIAETLEGQVESRAKDFRGAVAATLSNLVRAGRVAKAKGGYQAVLRRVEDR